MAKYNDKIVEDICELIRKDNYTILEMCKMVRITQETYYTWYKSKPEFSDAIKRAREDFKQAALVDCKRSLMKLINGYTYQEKRTVTVDSGKKDSNGKQIPKIKEQIITEKHIQPNLGAIIHYQTNQDPDNWKNKQTNEITGKDGREFETLPPIILNVKNKVLEKTKKDGNNPIK